jgi:hypothetical protein
MDVSMIILAVRVFLSALYNYLKVTLPFPNFPSIHSQHQSLCVQSQIINRKLSGSVVILTSLQRSSCLLLDHVMEQSQKQLVRLVQQWSWAFSALLLLNSVLSDAKKAPNLTQPNIVIIVAGETVSLRVWYLLFISD